MHLFFYKTMLFRFTKVGFCDRIKAITFLTEVKDRMAIFKCKMCGGDLEVTDVCGIAECEYCGCKQTTPKAMDEDLQNLFNRANTLRIKSEFDKAERIYEKILQLDGAQAEAYWGLILCKYGIEYVEDPASFKRVPTCHRASYDSIVADEDYKAALEHADGAQRALYEAQAKEIDRIQKEILALAQKEERYDVFICYKETDASGKRTQDSVIANDIYYQLTQAGLKVFYAAITLEGKLGSAYEPIIFAALNSAKVMLCIGSRPEYFNAVWVKNEWSRFLKIISKDRSKLLIPCYRDMDAYELPEEFAHLQAQDMSKIGFINDVIRGVAKVMGRDVARQNAVVNETAAPSTAPTNIAPLLKRVFIFLEDGQWAEADEYCEKVLDQDPECAEAYLGKLMAELRVKKREELKENRHPFDSNAHYKKTVRYGDEALVRELEAYNKAIRENKKQREFNAAMIAAVSARTCAEYNKAASMLRDIKDNPEAARKAAECEEKANVIAKKAREEAERQEKERRKKVNRYLIVFVCVCASVVALILLSVFVIGPQRALSNGDYKTYIDARGIEEFEIPEGTTTISSLAFSNCKSLKSVKIPASVTSIGDNAFSGCTNLETVIFAEGSKLTTIGGCSFKSCSSLTTITIPDSVTSIGNYAFSDCSSLTSITIPDSVISIGSDAFSRCSSLTSITLPFVGESANAIMNTRFSYIFGGNVPDSLKTVVITGGTSIGNYAFSDCRSLTSITIPDGVISIGSDAFSRCSSLTSIIIPDSVTNIGGAAFYNCSKLTSITIPDSVTSIGASAFYGCSSLTGVTFKQGSGWKYYASSTSTSGYNISALALADPTTAAKYLTSTYYDRTWKRD